MKNETLSQDEISRYQRHLMLPEFGLDGQKKMKSASVLIVGVGGLGSPVAMYLAAAGVGRLGLVDFDVVDKSNLQRQVIHGSNDVGHSKLESAERRIREINPNVQIDLYPYRLTSENALKTIGAYDVVVDGTDNFPTRYLVNDASVITGTPNVFASVFRFEGQLSVFGVKDGPCYRCLYPEPPPPGLVPSCAEGGVLGVLPGILGTMQALEVIKLIAGIGEPLVGKLLLVDTLTSEFRTIKAVRSKTCLVCGDDPQIEKLIDYEAFCGFRSAAAQATNSLGTNSPPSTSSVAGLSSLGVPEISVQALKALRDSGDDGFVLIDVRETAEYQVSHIDGVLMPLSQLPDRVNELARYRHQDIIIYCRSGARSARAVMLLQEHGYQKLFNLAGGILAWQLEIDPDLPV